MRSPEVTLEIQQGRTFSRVLRWEQPRIVYREIQSASQAAPCVLVTTDPHGLTDGWAFEVSNARGMTELNSVQIEDDPPTIYEATVVDSTTIEINSLNAAGFQAYTGGGILSYNEPVDLSGMPTAAMQIRSRVDSDEVLLSLTTANGGIVIDNTAKTITIEISAVDTAAIDWLGGVWDLEVTSGSVVTRVAGGVVKIRREVTR